jgi:putative FmdB family regulatory protein
VLASFKCEDCKVESDEIVAFGTKEIVCPECGGRMVKMITAVSHYWKKGEKPGK